MTRVALSSTVQESSPILPRLATFAYGLLAYASFVAVVAYAIGFVLNLVVPKSIDSGVPGAMLPSLAINSALLMLFVIQHTVMARPWYKRWWSTWAPPSLERSTYVLTASASLGLLYWLWQPLPREIWNVGSGWLAWMLVGLSLGGWLIVLLSSFMVSHFDLFGLRQVWFRLQDRPYVAVGFRLVGLYKLVRHPLMVGFLIFFWSTPVMTVGHLFFAIMVTLYIRFGTWVEERDLVAEFGEQYLEYRRGVPGFLPLPRSTTH